MYKTTKDEISTAHVNHKIEINRTHLRNYFGTKELAHSTFILNMSTEFIKRQVVEYLRMKYGFRFSKRASKYHFISENFELFLLPLH